MKLDEYKLVFKQETEGEDSLEQPYHRVTTYECPLTELKQGETVPFKTKDGWEYKPSFGEPKFVCKAVDTDGVLLCFAGNEDANIPFKTTEDKWKYYHDTGGRSSDTYRMFLKPIE